MKTGDGFGRTGGGAERDVDTIELELKPEELRALTATDARPDVTSTAPGPAPGSTARTRSNRPSVRHAGIAVVLCLSAGAILFAIGRTQVAAPAQPQVAAVVDAGRIEPRTPSSAGPPVRFANPFDSTEVFEFAAGTTRAEARNAVAKLLTERAQERLAFLRTKRAHRNRSTPPRTATAQTSARLSMGSNTLPRRE
jgi:hypothetical protein